jgi:hypothetical protein
MVRQMLKYEVPVVSAVGDSAGMASTATLSVFLA